VRKNGMNRVIGKKIEAGNDAGLSQSTLTL